MLTPSFMVGAAYRSRTYTVQIKSLLLTTELKRLLLVVEGWRLKQGYISHHS